MRRHVLDLFAIGTLALVAGCPDRSISEVTPVQQPVATKEIPVSADIDILFVIDNSASTADKQTVFGSNFVNFVTALDSFPTGRPNLHMAVVDSTVDLGVAEPGCPSPNTSDNGLFQHTARIPGCMPPNGSFISDIAGPNGSASPRQTNYSGSLDQALACIAEVGANGCGFEAQLEGMKRALDGSLPQNAGFIRPGAYLAVIILTDEDDASTKPGSAGDGVFMLDPSTVGGLNDFRVQPMFAYNCDTPIGAGSAQATYTNCKPRTDSYLQDPAFYSSFLSGVKDPARTVVAVIGAPPPGLSTNDVPPKTAGQDPGTFAQITTGNLVNGAQQQDPALLPSCAATINGNPAIGRPGLRLASFLSAYGDRGKFYTVCQPDYSAALKDIGATLFNAISPCLEGQIDPADADPNNPGTQLQCTVSDVLNLGGSDATQTLVPACKMSSANTPDPSGARPCWWTDQDSAACPAPDTGFELHVERSTPAATGTTVDVQCAVTPQG
jgi:hypothetical protein